MAARVPKVIVGVVVGATVLAGVIAVSAELETRGRAVILLPLIAGVVALIVWVVRRCNAEIESHRTPLLDRQTYAVDGPSPYESSLTITGHGRCVIEYFLRGRASGSYELIFRDDRGEPLPVLPLNAGSSSAAWANAAAPGVAYDEGGPGATAFTPEGAWTVELIVKIVTQDERPVSDEMRVEVRQRLSNAMHRPAPDAAPAPPPADVTLPPALILAATARAGTAPIQH